MFNGFIVSYFPTGSNRVSTAQFKTEKSVLKQGFREIPSAVEFAQDVFESVQDRVLKIVDLAGKVLYDNAEQVLRDCGNIY